MLNIQKILVPVVFADTSRHAVQQAAWLARRFHAEIILLHVVSPFGYPVGLLESGHEMTARDLHAHIVQRAQQDLDQALHPELDGIAVTRLVLRGDPAREIVETARNKNVDLIVMSTLGEGAFFRFLLGSVAAKVLHESQCPVWTGAHLEDAPAREFSIRHVLCSVDLTPHNRHTASLAAEMAAAVDATLTLVHITSSVEIYGPGGFRVDPAWKEMIVGMAADEIARLQQDIGTKAEVIIDSGNVPELLNRAAEQTKADVLVIGHIPGRSHLGDNGNGYGIIRASQIPVLSV
ncbi:MAG: universal stress protein [Bryobacteraceae bacterium]|jgi:nucleotide-binding universal stress UspA family protein